MSLSSVIALKNPDLKNKLISAGVNKRPTEYVQECLKNALVMSIAFTVIILFIVLQMNLSLFLLIPTFIVAYFAMFQLNIKRLDVAITRRAKEIDRDVIFAGRFLLVKLNSGKPLINAIFDASESYGVAGEYFQEIVEDIKMGTPLEDALEKAYKTTPSKRFKRILFQINNALKIGVDVSEPLEAILEEISKEQLIEIQRYGKKLSSLVMFYLLLAIVVPSLGITLFSIVASMIAVKLDMPIFYGIIVGIILIQVMFIGMIKGVRPNLNI